MDIICPFCQGVFDDDKLYAAHINVHLGLHMAGRGTPSLQLRSRHRDEDGHARMWGCINCHAPVTVYSRVDEFTCPECGYVTDVKLLRKLAQYELDNEKKEKEKKE